MKNPIKLPAKYEDRATIRYMKPGDIAWTLPWAVMVDEDHNVWINGDYPARQNPGGTVQMMIRRLNDGIEIMHGMEPQRVSRGVPWVGSTQDDLLPVIAIN